jgi:predicted DNA-binding protein with PD1-like motif
MTSFVGSKGNRIVVINLRRDEKLLEKIRTELKKLGIKNGVILSAIGSLQKAVFHRVVSTGKSPEDEFVTIERPIELASLQGLIVDGEPHFHMVVSDVGQTYTGHLEEGTTVLYLVEITIMEIEGLDLKRQKDENNIAVLLNK